MYHLDNERHIKIGELVIAVKILSLIFLMIAVFIELPRQTVERYKFFNLHFSNNDFAILIGNAIILVLFISSLLLIRYHKKKFVKIKPSYKKQLKYDPYDIFETFVFVLLNTLLLLMTGLNESPYKIIFFFIILSVTIQHGFRYGIIVSSICSSIILAIDLIADQSKPNQSFQIDLILVGVFLISTWLIGYYRNVEEKYSLKMSNLAKRDDLTGLYSHGYFQLVLEEQLKEAEENNKPLSLLFIDIDYFKYFNDLFGHQAGDEVLKKIGERIEKNIKPPYFAARYGGEEFTIIMYDTSEEQAIHFAENLRKDIESTFTNKFKEISNITVSIGISSFPSKAKNKDELIKYADDALYRAKSFHKNRVEAYHSVLEDLKNDIEEDDIEIISSIKTLISIINSRDKYTYRHVERVVIYCGLIADSLNLSDYEKKILKYGAYLHDIGKINIPQEILNKKTPLTEEEWELLKRHPAFGVEIIMPVKSLSDVIPIILYHHERYDGKGYPENLAGDKIPYLARILTVADCFDAMTSNRPYGRAKSFEEGIQELRDCSSMQFDPEITKVFIDILRSRRKSIF